MNKKQILVLGRHELRPGIDKVEDFQTFLNQISEEADFHIAYYDDLLIKIIDGVTSISIQPSGEDIAAFDVVFMMGWFKNFREEALSCATYLKSKNVPFLNKEALHQRSISKLTQYIKLGLNEIPIPDTIYCRNTEKLNPDMLIDELGLPMIMKKRGGSRGADNFLINSREELIDSLLNKGKRFVFQNCIPNDGDLRVIVMNGKVSRVIKRNKVEGSHLSNTSQGATAEIINLDDISDEIKRISVKSSIVCDREFTGVDVMINNENSSLVVLEVNNMPQLVSGAFVQEKVQALHDSLLDIAKQLD
jgi:RimK family alpha-L-glutamate ligase